ncbi:large-conductance mechanosensitive channel MscL [Enterococcus canis]|uniref:Large-conductance mechanosensitive channel n=1 Tax=Enterococcus canis TaxID=214095 RepID=A0A1L8RE67_9ENTE|nr:large conductance mechanosensitive channel protein MscL [Enterococcus canis]OJG18066.1 large-conductance mechanosensitive channel MscL [Enterococcus canis]
MIKEFKEFMMRGNVLDMAVGVVIGSAFTAIVTNVVAGLITPLINLVFVAITNDPKALDEMAEMTVKIKGVPFNYGSVISALITFIITAFVLFMIVKFANKAKDMRAKEEPAEEEAPAPTAEDYLKEIRDLLAAQKDETTTDPTETK